jgi:hypothetical protein
LLLVVAVHQVMVLVVLVVTELLLAHQAAAHLLNHL